MDEDRAFELIGNSEIAVLATIRPDGTPRPVPVVYALLDDRRLLTAVDHKPKSTRKLRRLSDIERDGRVSVLWQNYEQDWDRLWWVRLDGVASVLSEPTEEMRGALITRYRQYTDQSPRGPWILITPESVVGWP